MQNELHFLMKKYRVEKGYTQQYVADILGVDKSTYSHYEASRRTPDVNKLKKLAELYGLNDELLGAKLPIMTQIIYPIDVLDNLEKVIETCKVNTCDYNEAKKEFNKLRNALKPVLDIRDAALDLPNISIQKYDSGTVVKQVRLDMRAEKLISECMNKQKEVMNW